MITTTIAEDNQYKLEIMVEQQDNMILERDKEMIETKYEVKPII
jgi:hypothetical protein